jgi:hypothetical protein
MQNRIAENNIGPEDFCFTTAEGKPIRQELAETVFYRTMQAAEFILLPEKRKKAARGKGRQKR